MELASQIKKYRKELNLSQDELAERVFVSRQSVSNWENGKTYPDLRSLLLLSEVFSVSLDQLVKGDLKIMKQEIDSQERMNFQKETRAYNISFAAMLISPIFLVRYLGWLGVMLWAVVVAVCIYFSFRVEKYKKKYDIQTYREIVAFNEGKTLDEIEKAKEAGKRPYQRWILTILSALVGAATGLLTYYFGLQ